MGHYYNVDIYWVQDTKQHTFFVRPYTHDLEQELKQLASRSATTENAFKERTTVTECDGTYIISTEEEVDRDAFMTSLWGMLFRRFLSESRRVTVDKKRDEKFYVVRFSETYIAPCPRKLAA